MQRDVVGGAAQRREEQLDGRVVVDLVVEVPAPLVRQPRTAHLLHDPVEQPHVPPRLLGNHREVDRSGRGEQQLHLAGQHARPVAPAEVAERAELVLGDGLMVRGRGLQAVLIEANNHRQ